MARYRWSLIYHDALLCFPGSVFCPMFSSRFSPLMKCCWQCFTTWCHSSQLVGFTTSQGVPPQPDWGCWKQLPPQARLLVREGTQWRGTSEVSVTLRWSIIDPTKSITINIYYGMVGLLWIKINIYWSIHCGMVGLYYLCTMAMWICLHVQRY